MPANLKACIVVVVAIVAAHLMCKMIFRDQKQVIDRIMKGWVLLTLVLFLTPTAPVYFLGSAIILVFLAPKPADDRLQFYFAMLAAIPIGAIWKISLPGIATLLELDHIKTLSLVLLIPLYFQANSELYENKQQTLNDLQSKRMFRVFFSFLFLAMLLNFREHNVTTIIRNTVETYLNMLVLVLVVFKVCRSREIVDKVLFAVLISGVIVAFIACLEAILSWNFYGQDNLVFSIEGRNVGNAYSFSRGGIVRTSGTMTPIALGLYMSFCLVLNHYFSGLKRRGNAKYGGSLLISCVLVAGLVFTGSRGAWMITVLMFGYIMLMQKRFKFLRGFVVLGIVVSVFSFPAIMSYLVSKDPYGTFQYRVDLIFNSIIAIKDNIYIGSINFIDHPALQASMQGQGIIDITNSYLGFALEYGVPMLVLLLYAIFNVIWKLAKLRRQAENSQDAQLVEWQARIILAIIIGGFTMIITVSLVDRIAHYLWVSLVLGMCVYRYGYGEQGSKSEQH